MNGKNEERAAAPVGRNTVRHHRDFLTTPAKYSVSGRMLHPDRDIQPYLETYYYFLDLSCVESIFGAYQFPSKLYGGWGYNDSTAMRPHHVEQMRAAGIGIALTLTNHFFDLDTYRESWPLLETLHAPGNSLIITSDELARHVRQDFPEYQRKASIVKHIASVERLKRAYDLYDYVLVPMDKNDDDAFLATLPEKDRVILFANAGCAYNCPARTCYLGNSQSIWGKPVTSGCSKGRIPREDLGYVVFDVKKLASLGFSYFKLIPPRTTQLTVLLRQRGWA